MKLQHIALSTPPPDKRRFMRPSQGVSNFAAALIF